MSAKLLCDHCGTEGAFSVRLTIVTYQPPDKLVPTPQFAGDLCVKCFNRAAAIINAALRIP